MKVNHQKERTILVCDLGANPGNSIGIHEMKYEIIDSAEPIIIELDDGEGEPEFFAGRAIGVMLLNDVIMVGGHIKDFFVPTSDVFDLGGTDAELIDLDDISIVYRMWRADPIWGHIKWAIKKRNRKPHPRVEARMRADGAWDAELNDLRDSYETEYLKSLDKLPRRT